MDEISPRGQAAIARARAAATASDDERQNFLWIADEWDKLADAEREPRPVRSLAVPRPKAPVWTRPSRLPTAGPVGPVMAKGGERREWSDDKREG